MIAEKKLTQAELDKREEIVLALKRDNPDMPKDQMYAIATAKAKKVAESMLDEKRKLLLTDEDLEEGSPSFNYLVAKATVEEPEKNFVKIGNKNIRKTMDIQTARKIVKEVESQQDEAIEDFNFKAKITDKGDTFEIGGDKFVREDVRKHRYSHIVEKSLSLNESYVNLKEYGFDNNNPYSHAIKVDRLGNVYPKTGLTHYKGFPGWPQGTWGPDFARMGFDNSDIGSKMPIIVSNDIVSKIDRLKGPGRSSAFTLVFSIPTDNKSMSSNFRNGKGLVFKYKGSDFRSDATEFTIALIENGFMKVKWHPGWLGTGAILAEYTTGGGLHLGTTSSSTSDGPVFNLHKRNFKLGSGIGNAKYRLFYYDDVVYPETETKGYYGVEASRKPSKGIGNLGRLSRKLPYSQYRNEIYGDDSTREYDSNEYITRIVSLSNRSASEVSSNGMLVRELERDNKTVRDILQAFDISGSEEAAVAPVEVKDRDSRREERPSLFGTPSTDITTVQDTRPTTTQTSVSKSEEERSKTEALKLASEILSMANQNNIDIRTITSNDLTRLSTTDLMSVKQRLESKIEERQNAASGLLTTLIGSFLTTQWQNIKSRFGRQVQETSEDALAQAMQMLKDAANPNSAIGKKIYTNQNITIAALLAAGVGGFFLIRRFLRDRRQRQLSKYMYGDFGARRELQQIARRSGLDKVPQRELMAMLPELERYELSSPQVRRLYDL